MTARSHRHIRSAPAPKGALARLKRAVAQSKTPELPEKPHEMSQRDYLIMLLHIAAELEHALMVEYLYAAYSLGGPGASRYANEVREWRDAILTVAREEMGHLLTVQNVLLLIGGPVSFEREDYPWSSPFYPFEFKLEPLSLRSLACYVYAEMPKDLTRPADLQVRRDVLKLVPSDVAPTVGEIYDRVIDLIGDAEKIPDDTFDPGSYSHQATWDEWGRGYRPATHQPYAKDTTTPPPHARKTRVIVAQMATRTDAIAALRDVAGQGEAEHLKPRDKMEDSHFDRFAKIFRAYQAILKKDPDWSPSRPVPTNPFTGEAKYAPAHATPITGKEALAWASLFNIRYRMLLSLLTYTFHVPRDTPESAHPRRAPILSRIFGEMFNLKAIAGILVRLPLGDPRQTARAGPPFEMPYTLTPPLPEENFWRMQLDLLSASRDLVETLLDSKTGGKVKAPADAGRYLHALRDADRRSRDWTSRVLDGITSSRRWRA